MRALLINTLAGAFAQRIRDGYELLQAARRAPEALGTIANDQIARHLLERLCLPGHVFVDVGAHIGSVLAGVLRHSQPSHLIAIEAIPEKAMALRVKFPTAQVFDCAAGEAVGEESFFIDLQHSGYSSLRPVGGSGVLREMKVPIRRIDDLVSGQPVDLVKIDVEGFELSVLRGAGALVKQARPVIMFESGPVEVGGYTKEALWRWLDGVEYCVLVPNRVAHDDDGLTLDGFIEAHLYPRRTTNYFAVPRERRVEIRDRARRFGFG